MIPEFPFIIKAMTWAQDIPRTGPSAGGAWWRRRAGKKAWKHLRRNRGGRK